jgi:biopolymer transport protein ExbD
MATMTPLQKRAERRSRHGTMVDMNLVSLIDVFTILIFFLLSNSGGVETISSPRAVKLPESMSQKAPKETLLVVVTGSEILVGSKVVASVVDAIAVDGDLIEPLKAELDLHVGREVVLKANEADSKRVTILGDKDIPYKLLRKVMATAARAGYTDVSFAVRQRFEP